MSTSLTHNQQLDLTATIAEVPQANSVSLLIQLLEAMRNSPASGESLAQACSVEVRTIHYYLELGRWLGFVCHSNHGEHALTQSGIVFIDSIPSRGRLFSAALFAKPLVQRVQHLKRTSASEEPSTLSTREACVLAIREMTSLSESTIHRRASGLSTLIDVAYKPSSIDWSTGQTVPTSPNELFAFPGPSFLTALAAREFGIPRTFQIGFPRQVYACVAQQARDASSTQWGRASYARSDTDALWFGSIPITEATCQALQRRGPDLRKLLVLCVPYITLAMALLTLRDRTGKLLVHITDDMYGQKLWYRDYEIGALLSSIEAVARFLELDITHNCPEHFACQCDHALIQPANAEELLQTLLLSGLLRAHGSTFEVPSRLLDELRQGNHDFPPILERLAPIQSRMEQWISQIL